MAAAVLQLFIAVAVLSAWLLAVETTEREARRSASRQEAEARRRVEALQEVTAGLATAATTDAVAAVLVRSGIGLLADAGSVGVVTPDPGRLRVWTTTAPAPVEVPLDDPSPLATTIRRHAEVRGWSPTALAVPARTAGRISRGAGVRFTDDTAVNGRTPALARTLAELMAPALHRTGLYEQERDAAHQLQRTLLPVGTPTGWPGSSWLAATVPPTPTTRSAATGTTPSPARGPGGLVVGDVVGHDLEAAAAMGRLHSALSVLAVAGDNATGRRPRRAGPGRVGDPRRGADHHRLRRVQTRRPAGCGTPARATLLRCWSPTTAPSFLTGGRSRPLAVDAAPRPDATADVPPGSMLLWYSDGLVGRREDDLDAGVRPAGGGGGRPGRRLAREWCDALMAELTGGQRLLDDVVLLCARPTG